MTSSSIEALSKMGREKKLTSDQTAVVKALHRQGLSVRAIPLRLTSLPNLCRTVIVVCAVITAQTKQEDRLLAHLSFIVQF